MMYGTLEEVLIKVLDHPQLQKALHIIQKLDVSQLQKGRNDVCEDKIYFNCMEYETATAEQKIWEAHRRYYDVHCVLDGEERIQISQRSEMTARDTYQEEEDYQFFDGLTTEDVFLRKGMVLICAPDDVHKVGVAAGVPMMVKKLVIKVKTYN